MTAGADAVSFEPDAVAALIRARLPWATESGPFAVHYFASNSSPRQGWKLHVSATPWSAADVLTACLPILFEEGVSFKVVSSETRVMLLNNGLFGESQVGKFVTVYPTDDAQALRLGRALHSATQGRPGPRVPRERTVAVGSLVHYRYGPFQRPPRRPAGEPQDAISSLVDHVGRGVIDDRDAANSAMVLVDPFASDPPTRQSDVNAGPLGGRFLIVDVLGTSASGAVFRGIDLDSPVPSVCVVKAFWRDSGGDVHGRLAPDWGRLEAGLLRRHQDETAVPRLISDFSLDGDVYVVTEYVDGPTLAQEIERREAETDPFRIANVLEVGEDLAAALELIHARGVVLRDLNPANVVRAADGWRLIDFGIAFDGDMIDQPPNGLGTADYCSPQQWHGLPPSVQDDVYSWGAVLNRMLVGELARSAAEGPLEPARRLPVQLARPDVPRAFAEVIDKAAEWDAAKRITDAGELLSRLRSIRRADLTEINERVAVDVGASANGGDVERAMGTPLSLAEDIGNRLCDVAIKRDGGACWAVDGRSEPFCSPDVYHGAAGIALFLGELGAAAEESRFREVAEAAVRWVCGPVWANGRAEAGLHTGESGVGVVLIRLAELWQEPAYLAAADLRARRLTGVRYRSPSLLDGAAGHAYFLARLAAASGNTARRDDAVAVAHKILATSIESAVGRSWKTGKGTTAGEAHLGLAHGAAGIGIALMEVAKVADDERLAEAARDVGDLLMSAARVDNADGWTWPETLSGHNARVQAQCHGAIGIGSFLLRLSDIYPDRGFTEGAWGAAVTARRLLSRRPSLSLCHGLAGDGIFLQECSTRFPVAAGWVDECLTLALQRWQADQFRPLRPELYTGAAGAGWFALSVAVERRRSIGEPMLGRIQRALSPNSSEH